MIKIENQKFFMINRNLDFTDYTPFEVTVFLETLTQVGQFITGTI